MKQNNFPKIHFFIAFTFFLLFLAGFLYFFYTIKSKNQTAQILEEKLVNDISREKSLKNLDESIEKLKEKLPEFNAHFAKSSDFVPFLDTIESLALQVGTPLEISSVDIAKDQSGFTVSVDSTGTFNDLYKLINLFENSPYELEFTALDIKQEGEIQVISADKKTKSVIPSWRLRATIRLLSFIP